MLWERFSSEKTSGKGECLEKNIEQSCGKTFSVMLEISGNDKELHLRTTEGCIQEIPGVASGKHFKSL